MSTKTERRCARRRERRKFSPVIPSALPVLSSSVSLILHSASSSSRRRHRCYRRRTARLRQTVQCAFLRTVQSGRCAGYASSAYRVARNRSSLFFLAFFFSFFSHRAVCVCVWLFLLSYFYLRALNSMGPDIKIFIDLPIILPSLSLSISLFVSVSRSVFPCLISNANGRHGGHTTAVLQ